MRLFSKLRHAPRLQTPQERPPKPVVPKNVELPRHHQVEITHNDEGTANGSVWGFMQGVLRNHPRPAAAAMIGATALPVLVGAPTQAMAAPPKATSEPMGTEEASSILFDAPSRDVQESALRMFAEHLWPPGNPAPAKTAPKSFDVPKPPRAPGAVDDLAKALPKTAGDIADETSGLPADVGRQAGRAVTTHNRVTNVVQPGALPTFNFTTTSPLNFTDPVGRSIWVPANTQISNDGTTLSINGPGLRLSDGNWTVRATDAQISIGPQTSIQAQNVRYTAPAAGGNSVAANFADARLTVDTAADGSQQLRFNGDGGKLTLNGHIIDIEKVDTLQIQTDAAGLVTGASADFPGEIAFADKDGDLSVVVNDAKASYDQAQGRLQASFANGEVKLASKGLTATIDGARASVDSKSVLVHIDSAHVLKEVGTKLDLEIEGIDLVIDKTDTGAVKSLDLGIEKLDGSVKSFDIHARTKGGEQIRLHAEMSEDGKVLRQAFLRIPKGGEVEISKADKWSVLLKEGNLFTLTNDGNGTYRVGAEHIDVLAKFKKTKVEVKGGSAEVSLHKSGEIVIEKVHGTSVSIDHKDVKANIDIENLDGFILRMTGLKNGAAGARIHLVPTSDASVMNVRVEGKASGIPFSLELDDVHELEAEGEIGINTARVLIQDPSGQGNIKIGVGPLSLEGSAIEVAAKYQSYDSQRMMSLIGRYASTDGVELVNGVTIESDGVIRAKTTFDGPHAELAVLLPRGTGAVPAYMLDIGGANDGGAGATLLLGWRGTSNDTTYSGGVFAGGMPGSCGDWNQTRGTARLGPVPLPSDMRIPATGVAGLRLDTRSPDTRVGVTVGGFVNPVGLLPKGAPFIEPVPYGGFAGVRVQHKDRVFGTVDALVNVDKDNKVELGGVRVMLGVNF